MKKLALSAGLRPGNIDWQIIRPIPKLSFAYTVIVRFDTITHLKAWMDSGTRKDLIKKAGQFFAKEDNYFIRSGLDFLFVPEKQGAKAPVRWKQYLVTWSAIYPLSLLVPLLVLPLMRLSGLGQNHYLAAFFISGSIVFIMVYALMPSYTPG